MLHCAQNSSNGSSFKVSGMTNIDAIALQQIMEVRVAHVDRIKFILSPYFWELLHDFDRRVDMARRDVEAIAEAEETDDVMFGVPSEES